MSHKMEHQAQHLEQPELHSSIDKRSRNELSNDRGSVSIAATRGGDERSAEESAHRLSEQDLSLLVQSIADHAIYMLDTEGRVVSWNKGAEHIEGYARQEIVGQHFSCFFPADDVAAGSPEAALRSARLDGRWQAEGWSLRKDGSRFWASTTITALRDDDGVLKGFAKVSQDITRRKGLEDRLLHRALHDTLTGLSNRELFTNRIKHALTRRPRGSHFTVLFMDLDGFKQVNDTLGHAAGDEVLRKVADRLRAAVRPSDSLARMGGDEFAVLLEDTMSERDALEVTKRIMACVDGPLWVQGQNVSVGASVGILPDAAGDAGEILRNADTAMYHAKENGGSYKIFNPTMQTAVSNRQRMERELSNAVPSDSLVLLFQPLVHLDTGAIVGAEALLRWDHPRLGLLPPEHFIPLAEQTGDIVSIGSWVLHNALREIGNLVHRDDLGRHLGASINLSARQFRSSDLTHDVAEAILSSHLAPADVTLEITESLLSEDAGTAISTLLELKDLGVRIALDDFGAGYSSLSQLRDFPVDIVKIGRSFISRVTPASREAGLMAAIMHMADTLQLDAIATGIETSDQLEALRGVGCTRGQGFYFSKPITSRNASILWRTHGCDTAV